jgi:hypothetical protein
MSSELIELENRLRAEPDDAEASGNLRGRVMAAVAAELAKPLQSSSAGQWDVRYWAAAAATVLIVLNLSLICASREAVSIHPSVNSDQLSLELQWVRQLEAQPEGILK